MPTGNKSWCHSSFPLTHTTIPQKIVAIHNGKFMKKEFNGTFIPSIFGTLTLQNK